MTLLDTFLTVKLIFKQSKLLTSAFLAGRARTYVLKGSSTERGVHGCNFEDRDFGFFAKVIICAQLTYLDGLVCHACTRARHGAVSVHVTFFKNNM